MMVRYSSGEHVMMSRASVTLATEVIEGLTRRIIAATDSGGAEDAPDLQAEVDTWMELTPLLSDLTTHLAALHSALSVSTPALADDDIADEAHW